jgi:hypothetical protein
MDGWNIGTKCLAAIKNILPENKIILEFGSGAGSEILSKYHTVYSVEDNSNWVNEYNTNYIYAPLKLIDELGINWYDPDILIKNLPERYDLILVDGPVGGRGKISTREGFYHYIDMFELNDTVIIFDDVNRKNDYNHMLKVSEKFKRTFNIFDDDHKKKFGVIL